jgi:hypothetical protein
MGMGAPKGMAAPQAGLAAISQPSQAPKGRTSGNMAQVMAMARKMSDGQLAEVLQGKSLDVPQYVAMTEAMGRKSLRTAMEGQQAAAQAKQPSVKDKFLMAEQPQMPPQMPPQGMPPQGMPQQPVMAAEGGLMYADGGAIDMNEAQGGGGIAELPAPNMMPMTMADGGIVAFQDNPDQPVREGMPSRELTEEEKKQLAENPYMQRVQAITNPGKTISEYFANRPSSQELFNRASKAKSGELKMFTNEQTPKGKLVDAGLVERTTPIQDVQKVAAANLNRVYAADNEDATTGAGMMALANAQKAKPAPSPTGTDQRSNDRKAALASPTSVGITPERRTNPFGALKADLPDYEKVKNQGLGEGLMVLSGALFGNPNLAMAMNQGLPALAKISGATRKEVGELKKDYNAQQLNLAKANELFEQGQEDKAFKYLKQSQDNAVDLQKAMAAMTAANKPSGTMELYNAVKSQDPSMKPLDIIAAMSGAKNEPKAEQALRDKYAGDKTLQLLYPNIDDYIKKMTPAGATMAGNTGNFSAVYGANGQRIQ